jgi:tetratricopeptide (TPR) repeat protein
MDGRVVLYACALAEAREKAGDLAGAAAALEKILTSPGDRLRSDGYYARAVLGLARLEEKRGRRARALELYRSFLELWKNADPGLPEIEEARGRLSALSAAAGRGR